MSFYIQHGYGKSNKIDVLAATGAVQGVIVSPGDEDRGALSETVGRIRGLGLSVLLDPQSYVYSLTNGAARCHTSHGLALPRLHWSDDSRQILANIAAVHAASEAVGIEDPLVAPTCLQTSFNDVWTPLALQYARTASAEWGGDRTFVTVAFEEAGLADWRACEEWLDVATTLNVQGFYLLVSRPPRGYPPAPWEPARLANLLRLIYNLSEFNDYDVIWGYSDLEGLLGVAAGATASASGWHYSLRAFNTAKWQPAEGQPRPPVARIYLGRLWTPVRAEDEGRDIFRSSLRDEIFSQPVRDRFPTGDFTGWSRQDAQVQHLRLLAQRAENVASFGDVSARVAAVQQWLSLAERRFSTLRAEGVALPASYPARVRSFIEALDAFVALENL